jgi:hypothetical protein
MWKLFNYWHVIIYVLQMNWVFRAAVELAVEVSLHVV